ncbi:acylphosphatase [Mesorhizobium sp. CA12]|uniref:acylphosphatase n=1 Tax=Mesorhizobium sp. CA12 TaxID=2876644 RepID=UPI00398D5BE0
MNEQNRCSWRERMTIFGDVEVASFLPWIERHAAKLGLAHAICVAGPDRVELDIAGPVELIDMMEMGCSLGPIDVWVETIRRAPIESESG